MHDPSRLEQLGAKQQRRVGEEVGRLRLRGTDGGRVAVVRGIARPDQQHALPRHREGQPGAIERHRDSGLPRVAERQQEVRALAQPHERPTARVFELPDPVDPGPGRIHERAGSNKERALAEHAVRHGSGGAAAFVHEVDDAEVVGDHRAGTDRCATGREHQSPVVRLRLGKARVGAAVPGRERWNQHPCINGVEQAGRPLTQSGEQRVEDEPAPQERTRERPLPVDREQDGQRPDEVRRDARHQLSPLVLSSPNEPDQATGEVLKAAVNEFRRRTRSRASEVARVHEGDPQSTPRRVVGNPAPKDARADDE